MDCCDARLFFMLQRREPGQRTPPKSRARTARGALSRLPNLEPQRGPVRRRDVRRDEKRDRATGLNGRSPRGWRRPVRLRWRGASAWAATVAAAVLAPRRRILRLVAADARRISPYCDNLVGDPYSSPEGGGNLLHQPAATTSPRPRSSVTNA